MTVQLTRVSIVTETYAPEVNGVANTLAHLVKGMRSRGIAVQIIRPRQNRHDVDSIEVEEETVTLPGLPLPGYKELKFGLPLKSRILSALQRFKPQALYVATEGPMGWASVKAASACKIPVMSGFHTNFHQYGKHYHLGLLENLGYRYLRYFHNLTAGTLVPTQTQRDELETHGFHNVSVMSRGVDSQMFHPAKRSTELRRKWGVNDNDLVLLYVGRIAAEKNIKLAITTYQQLKAADDRVRLVLVGDGPELAHLRERHPDIICCGTQRGEALAQHFASGDVFLFPSLTDTFGNVVTEALASGLALVSFDYAAAHEHTQDGVNAMLAPFGDEAIFVQRAGLLLDSPNRLRNIRYAARHTAERISWHTIVDEFLQHLAAARPEEIANGTRETNTAKSRITVS
ncbi:MAG: glycoside hydrolase [Thalassobium sp.]|jgi:glycosyltransferase involved in cell wall biosynthesis|uniref:Glycosyltransferase n=1 Tax=hydrothermal vent metagenome TaxID=652676 RepID=A0A160T871_9ZZZZ|nr:glycosyltransferase family 1 protein [Thalassolituus oleivorans]PHQ84018.1 MAG: glycoside hydrolase [Thalassobium sp.]PHQ86200.1 MAG: glycoside hydrolase [Thalassobium sp.]